MTLEETLRELDVLLRDEERALVAIELDRVADLADRKTLLVEALNDALIRESPGDLSPSAQSLARSVHERAHRNRFLVQHLRGCLSALYPTGERGGRTYGRDGRARALGASAAVIRVRL
jgi:hypothetical protein